MKVHITADMEGIATISHDEQADYKSVEYPRMREIMTGEVEAAIQGAKDGGADRIVVCDAHDTGRNLIVDDLDDDIEIIQGNSYDLGMMHGISRDCDASFQVGYHSMRHTHAGVLGHTYTYDIAALRLNGKLVGETGLSAAIAGHFGVPVVLVSGDAHAVKQLKTLVKNVVGVPTKEGIGLYGVHSLAPAKACTLIRKGAKEGFDGFVIACFGDPALSAAREAVEAPVVGIAEAAMSMSFMLGRKFSILTVTKRAVSVMEDMVKAYGFSSRLASIRHVDIPVPELEKDPAKLRKALLEEGRKALAEDDAEVLLLGCAGMAGLDEEMEKELGVPVIDGVVAAVKLLEAIISYGKKTSKILTYQPIEKKSILGFSETLQP